MSTPLCSKCHDYFLLPDGTCPRCSGVMSRSVLRRQAVQRGEEAPTFPTHQTKLTFKRGPLVVATVEGLPLTGDGPTEEDAAKVIEMEQTLEKLTGFRVHITVEGTSV